MINELCIIHKRNKIEYVFCTTVRLFNTRINPLTSYNIFHIVYHFNLDISQWRVGYTSNIETYYFSYKHNIVYLHVELRMFMFEIFMKHIEDKKWHCNSPQLFWRQ